MQSLAALGRPVAVPETPSLHLLEGIPRALGRAGIAGALPPAGVDLWRAHEVSWCRPDGRPEVALAHIEVGAGSPRLIESKSLKLALGSLNFATFASPEALVAELQPRLAEVAGAPVRVALFGPRQPPPSPPPLAGTCLDACAVGPVAARPTAGHLTTEGGTEASETVYSHLLRSLCPVTHQPDWATVVVSYRGEKIGHAALLRYLLSYRRHASFHESLVEQIWCDILARCRPSSLTVFALFTRRGGIDINPLRSTDAAGSPLRATFRG